ncbi:MAG: hypothetical protein ACRDA5_02495 [Clostridium sp.]
MNNNIRRILMCGIIAGVTATGIISCSKNPEDKAENKKVEAKQSDQQIIDRIVAGAKEYASSEDAEFIEKYKGSIKIVTKDERGITDQIITKFELDYSDGVIIAKGDFTIVEQPEDIRISTDEYDYPKITYTINPNVTKEDVEKNIAEYLEYIDFDFVKSEENTQIKVEEIYVKTLNNGESRLTVDFTYTHKDDYVNATGTGEFWLTDGKKINGETVQVKNDVYEMFPPSIDEVKKGIKDRLVVSRQRGTIAEEVYNMSDKEADSLEIKEIKEALGYSNSVSDFDIVATFQKGEEIKDITGQADVIVRDGKYVVVVSHIFVEQI